MTGRPRLAELVYQLAEAPAASLGLELLDVELVREGKSRILRLIIDKPGGVDLEDCSALSNLVDPLIDSRADISGHDYFEVSSPGLDRPLKTQRDYDRYQGELVELKLYKALNGEKVFRGKLAPCSDTEIRILLADGSQLAVQSSAVAKIKRTVQF
ncbi:MAG: ribosome maturation factor RimP [Bacillota bacterium]|nr:ribosome maturation factor RimP [Bacillota bacterium]